LASALGADSSNAFPKDYTAKLPLDQRMYFMYYVQDDTEDGLLMDTKIPIKEVRLFYRPREFGQTWLWAELEKIARFKKLQSSSIVFQNDLAFLGHIGKASLSEIYDFSMSNTYLYV
jgi:hypothetical protein